MNRGPSKPEVVRSNRSGRTDEIIRDFGDLKIGRGNRVATSEGLSVGLRKGAPKACRTPTTASLEGGRSGSAVAAVESGPFGQGTG